jgi:hypothetical protein
VAGDAAGGIGGAAPPNPAMGAAGVCPRNAAESGRRSKDLGRAHGPTIVGSCTAVVWEVAVSASYATKTAVGWAGVGWRQLRRRQASGPSPTWAPVPTSCAAGQSRVILARRIRARGRPGAVQDGRSRRRGTDAAIAGVGEPPMLFLLRGKLEPGRNGLASGSLEKFRRGAIGRRRDVGRGWGWRRRRRTGFGRAGREPKVVPDESELLLGFCELLLDGGELGSLESEFSVALGEALRNG